MSKAPGRLTWRPTSKDTGVGNSQKTQFGSHVNILGAHLEIRELRLTSLTLTYTPPLNNKYYERLLTLKRRK